MRTEAEITTVISTLGKCLQSGRYGGALAATIKDWIAALDWASGMQGTTLSMFVHAVRQREKLEAQPVHFETIWGTLRIEDGLMDEL